MSPEATSPAPNPMPDTDPVIDAQITKSEVPLNPFEVNNYVRLAPTLIETAQDYASRDQTLEYLPAPIHLTSESMHEKYDEYKAVSTTEGEALAGFLSFLDIIDNTIDGIDADPTRVKHLLELRGDDKKIWGHSDQDRPQPDEDIKAWLHRKVDALKSTSFLGEKELEEAAAGIADYWKAYLSEDPERQIYLPHLPLDKGGKSYSYVAELVLSHFTPEERQLFRGRIVNEVEQLSATPDKAKIILLDDWMMSGDQMQERSHGTRFLFFHDDERSKAYADSVEINLLIADEERLEKGVDYTIDGSTLPVKAYFKAPAAVDAQDAEADERYRSRITGVHSSADVHFSLTVSNILEFLRNLHPDQSVVEQLAMPPLTNIVRSYRQLQPVATREVVPAPQPKAQLFI